MKFTKHALLGALMAAAVLVPATAAFAVHFTDVDGTTHEANIEWLETTGITTGCTATEYCPDDFVKRGQMATFLRRVAGQDAGVAPMVNAATALAATNAENAVNAVNAGSLAYLTPFYGSTDSDAQGGPATGALLYEDANIKLDLFCDDGNDTADGGVDLDLLVTLTAKTDNLVIATQDDDDTDFDTGETSDVYDLTGNTDNAPSSDNDIDEGFIFSPDTGDFYSIDGETMMGFFDGTTCHTAFTMTHFNIADDVVLP